MIEEDLVASDQMWFSILGPVRVWRDRHEVDLSTPQHRAVLTVLLMAAGRPVSMAELIDVTWGDNPPGTAVNGIHRTIGMLRRLLEPSLTARETGRWLVRAGGGYRMAVDARSLDLLRFRELVEQGRATRSVDPFVDALILWQGSPGSGAEVRERPAAIAIDREYQAAAGEAADLALISGTAERAMATVRQAADRYPLDEALQARVVLLLAGMGRQSEALEVYREVTQRLAEELGVDPGSELRAAQSQVLRQAVPSGRPAPPAPTARPAQLPPDLAVFVGRRTELSDASTLTAGSAPVMTISAVGGMAGIGKTTLAVHWAHQVADRYPDGQLHVDLRGFDPSGQGMDPGDALAYLLTSLGMDPAQIPTGLANQTAAFRSLIWGRRMLLLLDNARDEEQIRPLLPGSPGCLVIVTSRRHLSGLVAVEGAVPLALGPLDAAEARDFLSRRLGADRITRESEAVDAIVDLCAGLPLALAIVAARAALRGPRIPLATLAAELRRSHGTLDAFAGPASSIDARAVFSWSYQALSDRAAAMFRLLPVHPGPDAGNPTLASLAGVTPASAAASMAELLDASLLGEGAPSRYRSHDLLRAYAAGLDDDRPRARERLLDYYVHSAYAANRMLRPHRPPITLEPAVAEVTVVVPDNEADAHAWLACEEQALLSMVDDAALHGYDRRVVQLVWSLSTLPTRVETDLHLLQVASAAADRLGDRPMTARLEMGLARVYHRTDDTGSILRHYERALKLYVDLGDLAGQALVHFQLGNAYERIGRYPAIAVQVERALKLYREIGDRDGELSALSARSWAQLRLGEYRDSIDGGHRLLQRLRDTDDPEITAGIHDTIGYAHHLLGEHDVALVHFEKSLDLLPVSMDQTSHAAIVAHLGDARAALGDRSAAVAAWQRALDLVDHTNPPMADELRVKMEANLTGPAR
ncbi:AfsR/SARP family transcriptional regulator [Paractinoplanes maris]|uniref:AfsR/SARP family transcriptional regulator n=1 Tax=Paractinoplanes maris TaxID=1734446 RepID=UPI00201FF259|nr:BTAD domain-containing putative transcriptional regulator [Actinoplanes maris]